MREVGLEDCAASGPSQRMLGRSFGMGTRVGSVFQASLGVVLR